VLPKQGGEGTVICDADPEAYLDEGQRGLCQQLLRALEPAVQYVLMRCLSGRVLEQARKVGGAHLRYGSKRCQGQLVL
jgi:hypothetical protein